MPFPEQIQGKIRGSTLHKKGGYYLVFIDNTRAPISQRRTLGHELVHICLDHLEVDSPSCSDENERQANKWAWDFYRLYKHGFFNDWIVKEEHLTEPPAGGARDGRIAKYQ